MALDKYQRQLAQQWLSSNRSEHRRFEVGSSWVAIRQQQVRYQLTDPTPAFQDGQLMANEKANRKPVVEEDLPNPGERQSCRMPDWWSKYSETDLQAMHARGRQLVAGELISWDDLIGMR